MRYEEVKQLIRSELRKDPSGLTWAELKSRLRLPYKNLCPQWTIQLEDEIGLIRKRGDGRAYIWRLARGGKKSA